MWRYFYYHSYNAHAQLHRTLQCFLWLHIRRGYWLLSGRRFSWCGFRASGLSGRRNIFRSRRHNSRLSRCGHRWCGSWRFFSSYAYYGHWCYGEWLHIHYKNCKRCGHTGLSYSATRGRFHYMGGCHGGYYHHYCFFS